MPYITPRRNRLLSTTIIAMLSLIQPTLASSSSSSKRPSRLRISQSEKLNRRRLFEHYLDLKTQRIPAAFQESLIQEGRVLHTSKLDTPVVHNEQPCRFKGSLGYALTDLRLDHASISIQRQQPQDDNTDNNNLWQIDFSLTNLQADLTAQLNGQRMCDSESHPTLTDYTSYGHVSLESVEAKATVRLDGPNHQPRVVDVVDRIHQEHRVVVIQQTNPTFRKLLTKVSPGLVEASIYDLVHGIFNQHLQRVIETQLTSNHVN